MTVREEGCCSAGSAHISARMRSKQSERSWLRGRNHPAGAGQRGFERFCQENPHSLAVSSMDGRKYHAQDTQDLQVIVSFKGISLQPQRISNGSAH